MWVFEMLALCKVKHFLLNLNEKAPAPERQGREVQVWSRRPGEVYSPATHLVSASMTWDLTPVLESTR